MEDGFQGKWPSPDLKSPQVKTEETPLKQHAVENGADNDDKGKLDSFLASLEEKEPSSQQPATDHSGALQGQPPANSSPLKPSTASTHSSNPASAAQQPTGAAI